MKYIINIVGLFRLEENFIIIGFFNDWEKTNAAKYEGLKLSFWVHSLWIKKLHSLIKSNFDRLLYWNVGSFIKVQKSLLNQLIGWLIITQEPLIWFVSNFNGKTW